MAENKLEYIAVIDEIYHKNFHLFVNVPKEQFINWLIEVHEQGISDDLKEKLVDAKALLTCEYAPFYYLWIENFDWSIEHQGVVIHELSHFVDFVLSNAGIKVGRKNTEVRAYYLEYIMVKVWEGLKPLYSTPKKKAKADG